jgi:hypothetical protein
MTQLKFLTNYHHKYFQEAQISNKKNTLELKLKWCIIYSRALHATELQTVASQ